MMTPPYDDSGVAAVAPADDAQLFRDLSQNAKWCQFRPEHHHEKIRKLKKKPFQIQMRVVMEWSERPNWPELSLRAAVQKEEKVYLFWGTRRHHAVSRRKKSLF
jgi:hypothetical protein